MRRFDELEGLRGFLATWVMVSHLFLFAGANAPWPFDHIANGALSAVYVFMILSGFVIAHLLIERRESYAPYLIRRLFRLYPVYVVCLVFSIATLECRSFIFDHAAWSNADDCHFFQRVMNERANSETQFYWQHVTAHFSMLHGLFPDQLLNKSGTAFLGPAWSISLEWQFYILAPAALLLLSSTRGWMVVAAAITGFYLFSHGYFGSYYSPSSIMGMLGYFVIGIVCRLFLPGAAYSKPGPALLLLVAILLIVLAERDADSLIVWAVAYAAVVYSENFVQIRALLTNKIALFLGRISYPIYLVHFPTFFTVAYFALRLRPDIGQPQIIGILAASIAIVLAVSYILHIAVERPGIRLGTTIAQWFGDSLAQSRGGPRAATTATPTT